MARKEDKIELTKVEKEYAAKIIREYLLENHELEIGNLEAQSFLFFVTNKLGTLYYNKAVTDAYSLLTEKVEDLYVLIKD